eukprot:CAMPEP_0168595714 /NCGR_PEP_ID=MMETSP0420-20121227/9623_1 /TAXON_ID=498008 /ORGANISM="Pessonella sp." /LENGTH=61 /DNA_ID=CAMNT_0008632207 /DNA_START=50 /DNA_END=235 /DNA_ORIENTATION=-
MTCGGCSKAITALVSKVDGVDSVDANWETKEVKVVGNAKEEDVTAAIKKSGKEILESPSSA